MDQGKGTTSYFGFTGLGIHKGANTIWRFHARIVIYTYPVTATRKALYLCEYWSVFKSVGRLQKFNSSSKSSADQNIATMEFQMPPRAISIVAARFGSTDPTRWALLFLVHQSCPRWLLLCFIDFSKLSDQHSQTGLLQSKVLWEAASILLQQYSDQRKFWRRNGTVVIYPRI